MTAAAFEKVPGSIDFFISHPFVAALVSSQIFLAGTIIALAVPLYMVLSGIGRKKNILRNALLTVALISAFFGLKKVSMLARFALKPASTTVIAAIIDDKAECGWLLSKKYYLITKIEGKYYGVVTNAASYRSSRYSKGATFDYSLYAYETGDRMIMYRFLKPEFKLKAEEGNLQ